MASDRKGIPRPFGGSSLPGTRDCARSIPRKVDKESLSRTETRRKRPRRFKGQHQPNLATLDGAISAEKNRVVAGLCAKTQRSW